MNLCLNVKLICNVPVVAFIIMVILILPDGSDEEDPVPSTSSADSRTQNPKWYTQEPSDVPPIEPVFRGEIFVGNPVNEPISYFNDHLDGKMKANPTNPVAITVPELKPFIGMLVYMSIVHRYVLECRDAVRQSYGRDADHSLQDDQAVTLCQ